METTYLSNNISPYIYWASSDCQMTSYLTIWWNPMDVGWKIIGQICKFQLSVSLTILTIWVTWISNLHARICKYIMCLSAFDILRVEMFIWLAKWKHLWVCIFVHGPLQANRNLSFIKPDWKVGFYYNTLCTKPWTAVNETIFLLDLTSTTQWIETLFSQHVNLQLQLEN